MRLHDDEFDIDDGLVTRLLADQQPSLADLPISRVRSTGTVECALPDRRGPVRPAAARRTVGREPSQRTTVVALAARVCLAPDPRADLRGRAHSLVPVHVGSLPV